MSSEPRTTPPSLPERPADPPRRPYSPPLLRRLGSLRELTSGGSQNKNENMGHPLGRP